MKVGELFVNLGVKGAEKTVGALKSAKDGLSGIAETSLATKAAVAGVLYELGRLTASSNQYGLSLELFNRRTGINLDYLQRMEALMRKEGVSADKTMKSFEGLQDVIAQMATSEGVPKGFGVIADLLGPENFDPAKLVDFEYAMSRIWMAAKKVADQPAIRNRVFGGLNMDKDFLATLSTTTKKLSDIKPSEIYNPKERTALSNMAKGWADLGNQIEKIIGRLNIRFGPTFLKGFQEIVPEIAKAITAIGDLIVKLNVLHGIARVFHILAAGIREFTEGALELKRSGVSNLLPSAETLKFVAKDILGTSHGPPGQKTITNNINTTVNVDSGPNAGDIGAVVGDIIGRKFNDAFRQVPQGGGI